MLADKLQEMDDAVWSSAQQSLNLTAILQPIFQKVTITLRARPCLELRCWWKSSACRLPAHCHEHPLNLSLFLLQKRDRKTLRGPRFLDALEHSTSIPNEARAGESAEQHSWGSHLMPWEIAWNGQLWLEEHLTMQDVREGFRYALSAHGFQHRDAVCACQLSRISSAVGSRGGMGLIGAFWHAGTF